MNSDDDIVTRLRQFGDSYGLDAEAADEIERLRAENAWHKAVNTQLQADLAEQHEDQFLTYFRQALQGENNDI